MKTVITNRIFYDNNGTLTDLSAPLNNYLSSTSTVALVAAEDELYLGSDFRFNHRYIDIETANSNASVLSVHLWDGNEWTAAVDVQDYTAVAGASLAQSGHISWAIDTKTTSWLRDDTDEMTNSGLSSLKIRNLYWARLTVSADLSAGTALRSITFKFSEDEDLQAFYPELAQSAAKTQYVTGKTTWEDQHYLAAQVIIQQLKRDNVILSGDQIFDWQLFKLASVHKVAEIIYNAYGPDFVERMERARARYDREMNMKIFNVDRDLSGTLELDERQNFVQVIRR